MAQKKDQEKSKDQILKDKMRLQVMLPIILGVLTASIVISLIIFFSAPRWIQQVETNSMQVEGQNLKSLASSAGYVAQVLFQKVANDMLALNNILTLSINNVLQLNPAIQNDTTYFVGAKQFSENANDIFSTMPGYNSTNNKSLLRTTWFAVGPQENVDPFNDGGYSALPVAYQNYYGQWLSLLPMVNTLLDPSVYLGFYSPFDSADSGAQGLYCVYPIKASYSQYVKYTSTSDTDTFFTYKTRPYYKQATLPGNLAGTVEFIYPYLFVGGGQMGYTACINVLITSNQRILVCLDYLPDAIQEFIATAASQKNATYFVIERSTFRIIMYPNVTSILNQNLTNITQAEFGQNVLSTQEAYDFDANFRSFMANFDEESNFAMNFTMNDNDYILSLSIFQVLVSNNPNVAPSEYAVGLIIPLAAMKAEFSALEQNIRTPILIQIGILLAIVLTLSFVAHIMIGWVSKAITAPISKLVLLLRKIENPDDGEEEEEGKSKRLEVILKWIPHIESLSSELTELHKRFTLIKASFQYTKEAETALNDGDAIIKYSQALNIHKQLENVRGIGMVYNSIGNIHFKHGNYQEASRFYEQAISNSEEELAGFESFMRNKDQKKVSDGSSLAKVLKRSSSSHMFSTDILDKVKAEFEELHSNRLYFLAQTMLAMGQRKKLASVSAVERIRELLTQVVKYDREGKRNPYRIIICLLDIAATHLTIIDSESYNNAEMEMNEANGRLKIYEEDTLQGYEDELSQDYRIPSFVLRQKYHCTMGSFLLKIGMKRDACKHFTDAIEHGKVYDPIIRQICLKHLETIFEEYGLLSRAPNIQKIMYTSTKKNKDIVILLDYSQSMGEGKRINVAISNILKMFDKYIQPDDRMGFIRFNMNCDVVFSIIEKKKNTIFLRKNIEESIKPSGGTALYNAIYEGLKMLTRAEPKNHAKWIIALTDGEDNESRIRYEQLERKVARSDVNLIIIGLELQESNKPKLSKLCRQTSNGLFIESTSNEDLNVAFQVLSDIIYGSNVNVEKIPI